MKTLQLKRWVPYAAAVLLMMGFVRLGFWQLDRAAEKQALFAGFDTGQRIAPRSLSPAELDDIHPYTPVSLAGQYDQRSVLLDNQVRAGQQGVHVFTPLRGQSGKRAVLVNRGWLPMDAARRTLPDFETPSAPVEIVGLASRPPRPGIRLGDTETLATWPQLQTYIDLASLSEAMNLELAPAVVLLNPEMPHGFERDWRPQVMGADRHHGYAFQWFALALTILIVTVTLTLRRRN